MFSAKVLKLYRLIKFFLQNSCVFLSFEISYDKRTRIICIFYYFGLVSKSFLKILVKKIKHNFEKIFNICRRYKQSEVILNFLFLNVFQINGVDKLIKATKPIILKKYAYRVLLTFICHQKFHCLRWVNCIG